MNARTRDFAQQLKELHANAQPLVLPTVWDPWSARLAASAGFAALTVGSHPLAQALGFEDGERMPFDRVLAAVQAITASVELPVSVDLESGYGVAPDDLVSGLLDAGGVGLNLEDTVHLDGGRLRTAQEHASLIREVREAADRLGVPLVINGRTDLFMRVQGDPSRLLDEGIVRLEALAHAGADVVFAPGIRDDAGIARLVEELTVPLSVVARPDVDDVARLARLGVGRISFGPFLQAALGSRAMELFGRWK